MKVLITGAGGFIGSFLMRFLAECGYDVTGIVHNNIPKFATQNIVYRRHDLARPINFEDKYDAIIHAAGISPTQSKGIDDFKRSNVDSMVNLLTWAAEGHAKRMIYLSSISVYGNVHTSIVDEDTEIINPDDYGLTKYMAERILQANDAVDGIALRLPGVFGIHATRPWLARVVQKCIIGEDIRIYAPEFIGNNYLYVLDLASFVNHLLKADNWKEHTLVLGLQEGISILEAVTAVKLEIGSSSKIIVCKDQRRPFSIGIRRSAAVGYTSHSFADMIKECLQAGGWKV